jgi:hypothetical protein
MSLGHRALVVVAALVRRPGCWNTVTERIGRLSNVVAVDTRGDVPVPGSVEPERCLLGSQSTPSSALAHCAPQR